MAASAFNAGVLTRTHAFSLGCSAGTIRCSTVLGVPHELRLCWIPFCRHWAFFLKTMLSRSQPSNPPTAVASASPASSARGRHTPYCAAAVSWAFGRDDGGEAARWRDGGAGQTGAIIRPQATARIGDRGPPLKSPLELMAGGHGEYGVGRNGGGRGTCGDLVGAWRGSTAYHTLPVLRGPKARAHATASFGLQLGFASIAKAIGTVRVAAG